MSNYEKRLSIRSLKSPNNLDAQEKTGFKDFENQNIQINQLISPRGIQIAQENINDPNSN